MSIHPVKCAHRKNIGRCDDCRERFFGEKYWLDGWALDAYTNNFPAHKFNWYLSSDTEQEEAIEKALISLAFEKIFNFHFLEERVLIDVFTALCSSSTLLLLSF